MQENKSNLNKLSDTAITLNNNQLLDLLQITNANFPIGTFSHSYGLETYIRHDIVKDEATLKKAMHAYLFGQFQFCDLLAIRMIYDFLNNNQVERIWDLDHKLNCQGMSKETRKSARHVGTQMLKLYLELFPHINLLIEYQKKVTNKECYGNPAIVFALFAYNQNIPLTDALYVHTYSTCSSLVQNCVRAIPLGQVPGQKLMHEIKKEYFHELIDSVLKLDPERNFCKNNPSFEIAQMNHEEINIRLFMS